MIYGERKSVSQVYRKRFGLGFWLLLLCLWAGPVAAQSEDIEYPTPVRETVVDGRIAPRDLGDARLTRHFYVFTGTPGDLYVTLEGANLEGDIDLFLANGLRPVLKIGLYAAGSTTTTTKNAYLKRRETVIVRVEARTPDDQPGIYKISFKGAFEIYGGPARTPPPAIASATPVTEANSVRVNSAGARIDPPAPPQPKPTPAVVAAVAKPAKATPRRNRVPPLKASATALPTDEPPPPDVATKPRPSRAPKVPKAKPVPPITDDTPTVATLPDDAPPPPVVSKPTRTPKNRPAARPKAPAATAAKPSVTKPAKAKPPVIQTQLIVELKDGTRIVREAVRRVTIDQGTIVVVTAEGQIERYSLLEVAKMSVEPTVITQP